MGFHVCAYCNDAASSGDVMLKFKTGRTWIMPDMILHYITEHHFMPDNDFIDDVINGELVDAGRYQTKSINEPVQVGYLSGPSFNTWSNADNDKAKFFLQLWRHIQAAVHTGSRRQTRGM